MIAGQNSLELLIEKCVHWWTIAESNSTSNEMKMILISCQLNLLIFLTLLLKSQKLLLTIVDCDGNEDIHTRADFIHWDG